MRLVEQGAAHVVTGALKLLEAAGVVDRCDCVGGSFFDSVPAGADAYLLKSVIHDWPDADAVAILRVCRAAMKPGGKLLLVEYVIGPPNEQPAAKLMDLTMMVMLGAQERTEGQFARLFTEAGFTLTAVVPAAHGFCVLEGEPS